MRSRSEYLTQSDSVTLHVECSGREPPAVAFIHGFGDGAFLWRHVEPSFIDYGGTLSLDLRGHGDSGPDPSGRYALERHVEDVCAVLRRLAPQPVVLVGHSLGADVAISLAALDPERVRALVLVDGGPGLNPEAIQHMRHEFRSQPWRYESVAAYAALLEERLPLAERPILQAVAADALRADPEGGWSLKCDRRLAGSESDGDADDTLTWHALMQIRCPVQLLRGAFSAVLPRAAADKMVSRLPDCTLRTIAGAGHALVLERPDLFVSAVRQFVDGLAGRRLGRLQVQSGESTRN